MESTNQGAGTGAAVVLKESVGANHAQWEFRDRKTLLYALVGNDFGPDPETRLDEIREYKKNESKFLVDALKPTARDRVIDLGSGFGFIARVVAPLVERVWCLDISNEFLECAKEELQGFANVEFQQIDFADLRSLAGKESPRATPTQFLFTSTFSRSHCICGSYTKFSSRERYSYLE